MARKTPPAPPPPPLPTALLQGPADFASRLAPQPEVPWRYLGTVALSGVLSGVAYALLVRPAANLAAQAASAAAPGFLTHLSNVLGGTFLTALTFAVMWGLGRLAAGQAGRSGEVYGATFTLLPPLYLLVMAWTLLTPTTAFQPPVTAGTPGSVEQAALTLAAQTPAALALLLVAGLGTAAQSALAYPALRALTGSAPRALAGSLLPLLPALFLQALAVLPLLLRRWA